VPYRTWTPAPNARADARKGHARRQRPSWITPVPRSRAGDQGRQGRRAGSPKPPRRRTPRQGEFNAIPGQGALWAGSTTTPQRRRTSRQGEFNAIPGQGGRRATRLSKCFCYQLPTNHQPVLGYICLTKQLQPGLAYVSVSSLATINQS